MIRYRYSLEEVTPPAVEPLDLADVKTYLRIDHSSDDGLLGSTIAAVREVCETTTGLSLINRSYNLFLDVWNSDVLPLPKSPVAEVSAINVYASDDTASTYDASNYYLDNKEINARIVVKRGSVTPLAGREVNGIEVKYTAGFGATANDIPDLLKQGMMQLVAHLYEHRGDNLDRALSLSGAVDVFKSYRKVSAL